MFDHSYTNKDMPEAFVTLHIAQNSDSDFNADFGFIAHMINDTARFTMHFFRMAVNVYLLEM